MKKIQIYPSLYKQKHIRKKTTSISHSLHKKTIISFIFTSLLCLCGCTTTPYSRLYIINENASSGIYDPSLEYDENETGWMAYAAVEEPKYVHTHLATSPDHGKTWTYTTTLNQAVDDESIIEGGVWRQEVPLLLHDPHDPGKDWKLYWHTYLCKPPYTPDDRMFEYGWIAYKYAPHPTGPWSDPIALFGAGSYPLNPYNTQINLNTLHDDLTDFIVYTEPGGIVIDDVIYLSLTGHFFQNNELIGKTILIASYDHGKT